jgi:UDP-N-acetylglucosamine--N-acetylmuramyl-(pentapeptide) pyrophosphoryl-undecaprenol N-acetylglucosamine transferase
LSLARELKIESPNCRIVYVGHKGDNFDSLKKRADDFDFMVFIRAGKFRRYHGDGFFKHLLDVKTVLLNTRDFFRLPTSTVSSYRIMRKFQPDVVFSKGGFVAVPVGLAAKLTGVPIITHDSDTVPGLANRIIGRWARIHATGMPADYYDYPESTIEYVGVPLDSRVRKVTPKLQKQAKKILKVPEDSQVLLVTGGGNGSQHINELVITIGANLLETNLSLHIIHIAGALHEEAVKRAYKKLLPKPQQKRVRTLGFTTEFYNLTAAADLVIARAGATTLAELAVEGKACILIPAPFLAGGHQLKNAEAVVAADAAVILDETVQPDELLAIVNELLNDNSRRFELAKNLYGLARPNAAAQLAKLILTAAKG